MDNHQLLHLTQPEQLEFDAQVVRSLQLTDGRPAVILDHSYFYPTGGGQPHDTGWLGAARVVEVYKEGEPLQVVHVLDRPLPPGPVQGRIDAERRLRHRQHHSAQHLLSQCFLRLFAIESVSAHMLGDSPSLLDIASPRLTPEQIQQVEDLANGVIFEDRPIRTYFVTPEELENLPLRWPPAVSENIRIVEIEGFDYTPCGGTHCTRTGQMGLVKILKTERMGEQTRLYFVAGWQALETLHRYQEAAGGVARQLGVGLGELSEAVQRQAEALKTAQFELTRLRQERLADEARRLAAQGEAQGNFRLVAQAFPERPLEEVRQLANALKELPGVVAALATVEGERYSVLVTCAEDSGLSARDLLATALAQAGGKGGGNPRLAQGGGPGRLEQAQTIIATVRQALTGA